MRYGPRHGRWPALPVLLLCAGCATQAPQGDQWGVRRIAGVTPAVVSLSEVNPGQPAATGPLQPVLLRTATRGADAVTVRMDDAFAATWLPSSERVEPELQRALDWLERIDKTDARGLQLEVTLVDEEVHRRERRRHPATDSVRIDLLVPTAREPGSRSASVARALAIALHEAVHALRGDDTDRAADEHRASLVESCYLLDVARAGDVIDLGDGTGEASSPGASDAGAGHADRARGGSGARASARRHEAIPNPAPTADFTTRHSREAATRVLAELRRAAGTARIGPADISALRRARAFCRQRLQVPRRS
jgi:hypothetical protein